MITHKRKLGDEVWGILKPKCEVAAAHSSNSIIAWANIAHEAVDSTPHHEWRWLLADLRERCFDAKIECPYTITYLIQLAETYDSVRGNFNRNVPLSVLIEGRNLPHLLDVLENGMSVGRMKAMVFQWSNGDDRSIEEIEAEQKRNRLDGREKNKRKDHAEKIANWALDASDDLLVNMNEELTAYMRAISRLQAEGYAFDSGQIRITMHTAKFALSILEDLK